MLQKIKKKFQYLFLIGKKVHPTFWLFLIILFPVNFLCFKEKTEKQKKFKDWELAFEYPETHVSEKFSLKNLTNFYFSSQNFPKKNCQINIFFNNQKINEMKIVPKKEKETFSLPEMALSNIENQRNGKLEIDLKCDSYNDNIYKYLSFY